MSTCLLHFKFYRKGWRWRITCLLLTRLCKPQRLTEVFPEGTVHRVWFGPFLLKAMVDEAGKEHLAAARLAKSRAMLNRLMSDPSFGRQPDE